MNNSQALRFFFNFSDLDFEQCLPEYFFERYDTTFNLDSGRPSPASGFNFRHGNIMDFFGTLFKLKHYRNHF